MTEWEPVIGLEIHVHLKTRTKMFCACEVVYSDPPNSHTCPVCLAHPGALPVPNLLAIEHTVKLGLALGCEIAPRALFHRKNYFYPDNPKGYQISQYDVPLCASGVPPRLKSTFVCAAPPMRPPAPPTCTFFAASSSRCARVIPTSRSPSGSGTVNAPFAQSGTSYCEIWYPFGKSG